MAIKYKSLFQKEEGKNKKLSSEVESKAVIVQDLHSNIETLNVSQSTLESSITVLKSQIQGLESENKTMLSEKQDLTAEKQGVEKSLVDLTAEKNNLSAEKSRLELEVETLETQLKNQKTENVEAEAQKLAKSFQDAKKKYHTSRIIFGIIWGLAIFGFIIYLNKYPLVSSDLAVDVLISRWGFSLLVLTGITFISNQYIKADRNYDDFHNREVVAHSTRAFLDSSGGDEFSEFKTKLITKIPDILFKKIESRKKEDPIKTNLLEKILEVVTRSTK